MIYCTMSLTPHILPFHSATYIEVNNYQTEKFIYDVTATIYGGVEPGSLCPSETSLNLCPSSINSLFYYLCTLLVHVTGLHLSDTYWLSADEQPLVSAYQLVDLFCGVSFRTHFHLSLSQCFLWCRITFPLQKLL